MLLTCFTSLGKFISLIYEKWSGVEGINEKISLDLNPIPWLLLNLSLRKPSK